MSLLNTPAKKIIREHIEGVSEVSVLNESNKVFQSVFPEAFVVTYPDQDSGPNHYFVSVTAPGKVFQEWLMKPNDLRSTLQHNGFTLLSMKFQECKNNEEKVTEKFYIKLSEATWHQSKSKAKLYSPDTWNVVMNPPNSPSGIVAHKSEDAAKAYLSNLSKHNPDLHKHSYILPPGGVRPKG